MTKIKVDEKGLNAREIITVREGGRDLYYEYGDSYALTEPAEPNLVCEGVLIHQQRCKYEWCDNSEDYVWETIRKKPDTDFPAFDYRECWQIVKPMQVSKQENMNKLPTTLTLLDKAANLDRHKNIAFGPCNDNYGIDKNAPLKTEALQKAAEKYADEKTNKFSFGWDKEKAGRQLGFIAGATHQAAITKAETIEDVVRVIEIAIKNKSYPFHNDIGYTKSLTDLLSRIKNI